MNEISTDGPAIGTYFAPAPYIRQLANENAWGANNIVVAMPAPLLERTFAHVPTASTTPKALITFAAQLTARLNRTHRAHIGSSLSLQPSQDDPPSLGARPLVLNNAVSDPMIFLEKLGRESGIPRLRIRSDQAWVGGHSPLQSSLALPDPSYIPAQLADFMAVLYAQQANGSAEVAEALSYQLLTIHPLANGNGRITRTLLIQLAMRTGLPYPLYFAWRLMFDRVRTIENWIALAATGIPRPNDAHYLKWMRTSEILLQTCENALQNGLDERALNALLLYGTATEKAIHHANPRLAKNLAGKIAANLSSESKCAIATIATKGVNEAIEKLRHAVIG